MFWFKPDPPCHGFQLMFVDVCLLSLLRSCWLPFCFHICYTLISSCVHVVDVAMVMSSYDDISMCLHLIVVECRVSLSICQTSLCTHWSLSIGQSVFNTDHSVLNTLGFQWDGISEAMLGYKYWTSSSFWLSCCEVNISPVYIASRHGRMD